MSDGVKGVGRSGQTPSPKLQEEKKEVIGSAKGAFEENNRVLGHIPGPVSANAPFSNDASEKAQDVSGKILNQKR